MRTRGVALHASSMLVRYRLLAVTRRVRGHCRFGGRRFMARRVGPPECPKRPQIADSEHFGDINGPEQFRTVPAISRPKKSKMAALYRFELSGESRSCPGRSRPLVQTDSR